MKYNITALLDIVIPVLAVFYYVWSNQKRGYLVSKIIHFSIVICGLLLVVGHTVAEYFDTAKTFLESIGEVLAVWFVLLLIPGSISLLVIALLCWHDVRLVIPMVLLTIFLAIFWFAEDFSGLVTMAFILYSIVTLYLFLGSSSNAARNDTST